MKIELKEIVVRELVDGYQDNNEDGVVGYGGRLDIRPPFQREFVYKDKQREAVIDTITKNYPLNVMYWAVRDDGNFEIIDGQQRTISISQYVNGDFSFNDKYFYNLQNDEKEKIFNYKLTIYLCSGNDSEKLEWFKTINIAGEKLTEQELRNAVYAGSWVTDAKRYFSKSNCAAYKLAEKYMNGSPIRQEYLETAIKWINNADIEQYMAVNQHKPDSSELWVYFQEVINWLERTFTNRDSSRLKLMKGQDWGTLYNKHKEDKLNPNNLEKRLAELIQFAANNDVKNIRGIYEYVLSGDEKKLEKRIFSDTMKLAKYEEQKHKCTKCGKEYDISEMDADHIKPWFLGGKTELSNCQVLCITCNRGDKTGLKGKKI